MDVKLAIAIAHAFGNYRAAITAADLEDNPSAIANIVGTGKALLALQEATGVEVADPEQVAIAIESARNAYINR